MKIVVGCYVTVNRDVVGSRRLWACIFVYMFTRAGLADQRVVGGYVLYVCLNKNKAE